MNINKARNRDRKRNKRISGMQVDGRSVLLTQEIQRKRSEEIKKSREKKEELLNEC